MACSERCPGCGGECAARDVDEEDHKHLCPNNCLFVRERRARGNAMHPDAVYRY